MPPTQARGDERPAGPRGPAWQAIEKALAEGKPQTDAESLRGIEQAAIACFGSGLPIYLPTIPSSSTSNCSTALGGIGPPGVPLSP